MASSAGMLAILAPIIEEQIARRDTGHDIFHGCIDWHSAVHGHWALLRIARVLGMRELGERVSARFEPGQVAREARLLDQRREYELPYGRAWFLRLASEHARWGGGDGLRAMANAMAVSLRRH